MHTVLQEGDVMQEEIENRSVNLACHNNPAFCAHDSIGNQGIPESPGKSKKSETGKGSGRTAWPDDGERTDW